MLNDYREILKVAVEQGNRKMQEVNPTPIGVVVDGNGKEYAPIKHGLFGHGALLVKRQNRKFAQAVVLYCMDNKMYCEYSDYHKAYYVGLTNSHEYERLQEFYSSVYYTLIGCGIPSKVLDYRVTLD